MYSIESNLRAIRLAAKLSQEEVAEKLGIKLQQLTDWETGAEEIDQNYLLPLAKLLNCSMEDLAKKPKVVVDNEMTLVKKLAYLFQKQMFEEGLTEIEEFQEMFEIERDQLWFSANLIRDYWVGISRSESRNEYYKIVVDSFERMIQASNLTNNQGTHYHELRQFYYQTKEYEKAEATIVRQYGAQNSGELKESSRNYYSEVGELRLNEGKYQGAKSNLQEKLNNDLEALSQTLELLIENEKRNGLPKNQLQIQEDILKLQGLFGFFKTDQITTLLDLALLYQKKNPEHSSLLLDMILQKVLANRERILSELLGEGKNQLFKLETGKTDFYFGEIKENKLLLEADNSADSPGDRTEDEQSVLGKIQRQSDQEYLTAWLDSYYSTAVKFKQEVEAQLLNELFDELKSKIKSYT